MTLLPLLPAGGNHAIAWRNGEKVTASQFLNEVQQLAALLPAKSFVFNLCSDRYRFLTTFCAAMLRGQTNLLPPNHADKTLVQMHALYPDAYVISDREMALPLPALPYPELAGTDSGTTSNNPLIPADALAAILFTSGSTGEPQPYGKSWRSLVQAAQLKAERFSLPPGAQFVATVPPQHMFGLESSLMLPLQSGGSFHSGQPLFPADIVTALEQVPGPRVLVTTPLHLRICLEEGLSLPPLQLILSAAAPLSAELAQRAEAAFGAPVYEIYGCTEAGAIATRRTVEGDEWLPLKGLRVMDDGAEHTWVEGGHLSEPVPVQDMISLSPDGRFRLLGRKADMVNIAGKRASLAALNQQLSQIPGVHDAVFFVPDEQPGVATRLIALVVAPDLPESSILASLRQRIDPAFLPRPLYKVESLPRTATGKLPRETLVRLLGELKRG